MLAGLSAYLVVGLTMIISAPPFVVVAAMVVAGILLVPFLFPRLTQPIGRAASSAAELFARMAAGCLMKIGRASCRERVCYAV